MGTWAECLTPILQTIIIIVTIVAYVERLRTRVVVVENKVYEVTDNHLKHIAASLDRIEEKLETQGLAINTLQNITKK